MVIMGVDDGIEWEMLGDSFLASHRQLPALDAEIKRACRGLGFNNNGIRRVMTSCRELCSNMLNHAGSGTLRWYRVHFDDRSGIGIVAEDQGPGIVDMDQALVEGYSSNKGLGLGLGGVQRMMDIVEFDSRPAQGMTVTAIKWC